MSRLARVSGNITQHQRWMIRSYALTLGAVTLRIHLPLFLIQGVPFDQAYPAIAWLAWVPNLVIAEWVFVAALVSQRVASRGAPDAAGSV